MNWNKIFPLRIITAHNSWYRFLAVQNTSSVLEFVRMNTIRPHCMHGCGEQRCSLLSQIQHCWTQLSALQKDWTNWAAACDTDSGEPKEPCISWGTGSLQGKGAISVAPGTRPFVKILVPLVTNYKLVKKINNAVLYVMKRDCLIIPCRVVSVVVVQFIYQFTYSNNNYSTWSRLLHSCSSAATTWIYAHISQPAVRKCQLVMMPAQNST